MSYVTYNNILRIWYTMKYSNEMKYADELNNSVYNILSPIKYVYTFTTFDFFAFWSNVFPTWVRKCDVEIALALLAKDSLKDGILEETNTGWRWIPSK